jgi:CheY-like chemotaxis protein
MIGEKSGLFLSVVTWELDALTIHIACVENDPGPQFTFEQIAVLLTARGINNTLQFYDSRSAAINSLPAERPDIVFINLRMRTGRHSGGLDIVRALRQHPLCDNMVLVGMAEYAMPGDRAAAISGGCQDFVALPIRYQDVEDVILRQGVFIPA